MKECKIAFHAFNLHATLWSCVVSIYLETLELGLLAASLPEFYTL